MNDTTAFLNVFCDDFHASLDMDGTDSRIIVNRNL